MTWEARYCEALRIHVDVAQEAGLERAYELGREALAAGRGVLDVTSAHQLALRSLLPDQPDVLRVSDEATAFLAECLAPFEMLARGFQEKNAALADLAANLEQRVADRTADLRRAEERYRALIEQLPAVTYRTMADPPFPPTYVSPQVETLLGVTPQRWLEEGQPWWSRAHESDRPRVQAELRRALERALPFRSEYRLVAGERVVWVRDEARVIADREGVVVQGILLDITEQRQLADQLREAQRAESIGRLAGGIAHDFNNLLTIILSYAEILLQRLPPDDPIRADLTEICRAGSRAADLTAQLLAYSRRQVLEARIVSLPDLIGAMQGMLLRVLGEDVHLVVDVPAQLARVRVDPGQIEQVLLNLVVNARDAMPQGGRLTVSGRVEHLDTAHASALALEPGDWVVVAVRDTGTGMTDEVRERVFEPFFTTKEPGKGTGLGLATSYGIVRQSGGTMRVESEPGAGSTFEVWLPAEEGRDERVAARGEATDVVGGDETILLVEDEPAVRQVAARVLRERGYNVLQAADGVEALVLANAWPHRIDLVLTDVIMPGMSGKELVELVRSSRPEIRILYTSGYDEEAVARGVVPGAPDLLQKPVRPEALLRRVREILDR